MIFIKDSIQSRQMSRNSAGQFTHRSLVSSKAQRACGSSASACSRDSVSHCEAAGPLLLSHGTHRFCASAVLELPGPASAAVALIARGCACGSACRWTAQPRPPRSRQAWLGVRASLIVPANA